jgi:hypothetical protein
MESIGYIVRKSGPDRTRKAPVRLAPFYSVRPGLGKRAGTGLAAAKAFSSEVGTGSR